MVVNSLLWLSFLQYPSVKVDLSSAYFGSGSVFAGVLPESSVDVTFASSQLLMRGDLVAVKKAFLMILLGSLVFEFNTPQIGSYEQQMRKQFDILSPNLFEFTVIGEGDLALRSLL